jgi:hypothetical protein
MGSALIRKAAAMLLGAGVALTAGPGAADRFFFRDQSGNHVGLQARLVAANANGYVLETADGRYRLVPSSAAEKHEPSADPVPLTGAEMAARLQAEFSAEHFRSCIQEPFLIGLVLAAPLPKESEPQARSLLRDAAGFLKNVDTAFTRYAREMRIEARALTAPTVALIFESRKDFAKYITATTDRQESAARRTAGFYSKLTNILAIRLEECRNFEVPLHEAIHQQVYARGIFQRLAPIPTWFDEGLATGFEANAGKINVGPGKVSVRYAHQALDARGLPWSELIAGDAAFTAPPRVADAYGQAWAMHWFLVTRHKPEYAAYMRLLGQKQPLQEDSPHQRRADFTKVFGDKLPEMQTQFRTALDAAGKRPDTVLKRPSAKAPSLTEEELGQVELNAVRQESPGPPHVRFQLSGTLTNLSPLRPMAFHVTVETDAATYAEWLIPRLDSKKSAPLPVKDARKAMRMPVGVSAVPAARSRTFRVRIRSAPADSPEAQRWKAGPLPVPIFTAE